MYGRCGQTPSGKDPANFASRAAPTRAGLILGGVPTQTSRVGRDSYLEVADDRFAQRASRCTSATTLLAEPRQISCGVWSDASQTVSTERVGYSLSMYFALEGGETSRAV